MNKQLKEIEAKVLQEERISSEEALHLYREGELGFLARLATHRRLRINNNEVFYNRNFHIEPTNICIHNCLFCSYRRRVGDEGAWEMNKADILSEAARCHKEGITEVHLVGGVHPSRDLDYYADIIRSIHDTYPHIHIKAFTAVELDFMIRKSKLGIREGLSILKQAGLGSIPGGGAEIFDETLRKQICPDKTNTQNWLKIHQTAHELGIPTNATILYGHLETYEHRVDHMNRLRILQDQTKGFNVFIPLKYRNLNNELSAIGEVSSVEDLKNYALARIFLDNIPHLKAYWPMIGKEMAALSLDYGVDDLDGTIDDTTRIYSMAGVEDQNPSITTTELIQMIRSGGWIPVERDTLFNTIQRH